MHQSPFFVKVASNFSKPISNDLNTILQTNLIGMDALLKVLDPTQLTPDLDGALMYDHSMWIELRCVS